MRIRGGGSFGCARDHACNLQHRVVEIVGGRGFEARLARQVVERAGAEARFFAGNIHRHHVAREPAERRKKSDRILRPQHAADRDRAASPSVSSKSAMARAIAAAPCGLCPPSSQISGALRRRSNQRPLASGAAAAPAIRRCATPARSHRPCPSRRSLAQAPRSRRRRSRSDGGRSAAAAADRAGPLVLIDHAAMFLMRKEILTEDKDRRTQRVGAAQDDVARHRRPAGRRRPARRGLMMPAFSAAMTGDVECPGIRDDRDRPA